MKRYVRLKTENVALSIIIAKLCASKPKFIAKFRFYKNLGIPNVVRFKMSAGKLI